MGKWEWLEYISMKKQSELFAPFMNISVLQPVIGYPKKCNDVIVIS
jgi:hypothetical protein